MAAETRARVCKGSTAAGRVWATWVRYRRTSPVAGRLAEGLLTERTPAVRPWWQGLLLMPPKPSLRVRPRITHDGKSYHHRDEHPY